MIERRFLPIRNHEDPEIYIDDEVGWLWLPASASRLQYEAAVAVKLRADDPSLDELAAWRKARRILTHASRD